jgi:biofilm PGA synthesis lipoprotein PgaB
MRRLIRTVLAFFVCINVAAAALPMASQVRVPQIGLQRDSQLIVLAYHDVRENIKRNHAIDQFAVSAENMAMQFAWLRDNGYTMVNVDQVLAAIEGKRALPPKAVLLTFDDGLESAYTIVYPLLKLFDYPALLSVVTAWIESDVAVVYEKRVLSSGDFLSWAQMREMQESGLVEIASHSHNMHQGVLGNPQGNTQPAAVTRVYNNGYEDRNDYLIRIESDLAQSSALIKQHTGRAPRVMVWPYGQFNSDLRNLAALHGMTVSLSLDANDTDLSGFPLLGRDLLVANPGIRGFAPIFLDLPVRTVVRAAQVDLDYVYDPDPEIQERNLGVLLDRIKRLGISHVYLQAFADPDADGAADAVYFPNRHLPMRADLFNRASWQLQTRCGVAVFAWMPLLAFSGASVEPGWQLLEQRPTDVQAKPDAMGEPRLSPFVPDARRFIREIYSDLAAYADFEGIHFHDDGRMNEFEDANPAALDAYRKALGESFSIDQAHADSDLMLRWADLKAASLNEFSRELTDAVARYRPVLRTSRNLFASAILNERGTIYLAQNYDAYLDEYDYVTVMAMPMLENVADEGAFYDSLVAHVGMRPGALERTVFQLQAVDWREGYNPVPSDELSDRMRSLQSNGVLNLAYYPDDFLRDHPRADELIRGMSLKRIPGEQ